MGLKLFKYATLGLALIPLLMAKPAKAGLDRAATVGFIPHKALYEIKLSAKKSSAKVSNISGKMLYEWQPSCDAWISNHRFDMLYEYAEVPSMRITSNFSTYESFDGKELNFTSQRKRGDQVFQEIRGSIEQDENGNPNLAVYTIPEDLTFTLPEGTLFPIAHTIDVLEKLKSGAKFHNAVMFDGSDEDGPININTFIGKPITYTAPEEHAQYIDKSLINGKSWSLRLAFFPLVDPETTSDYEMSVIFHENGVISDMLVEYGDFSVTQKLIAIEKLGSVCNAEKPEPVKVK